MLEAICVTDRNKAYINQYLATVRPGKAFRVNPQVLDEGLYVVIRKNDVVIWKPAVFHANYEFIFDGEAKYFYFSSIRLRRHEVKFCGDEMPHNTHGVTTGQKTYLCHGPTSIDVEWDVDINLPMYTRDYIRINKTEHSPKESDEEIELPPQLFEFCGVLKKHKAHHHANDALCWGEPHRKE